MPALNAQYQSNESRHRQLTIDTSGSGFEDDSDVPIASSEFFNKVAVGDTVNAKGKLDAGGILTWEEMELEGKL